MMRIVLFLFSFAISHALCAAIKLPQLISHGMVLQRNTTVPIWGWADPGETVTLDFNHQKRSTVTSADGRWEIALSPMKEGGPFTMELSGSNKITINDILIGDVWICSGQSNMAQTMERVKDRFPQVIAETNNPNLRYFFIPTTFNFQSPQTDLPPGNWRPATPEYILQFSAIGFFFAKSLYEKYQIPVGLINTSVGGSPAEAWLSGNALKKFPDHLAIADKFKAPTYLDSIRNSDNARRSAWFKNVNASDSGRLQKPDWHTVALDDKNWQSFNVPGYWSDQGLKINGVVWFRKKIALPESLAGKEARLFLGNIVDQDSVFINGKFVGTTGYQYPPRKYNVPAGTLIAGDNLISIRVINSSGRGGFYKDKPYLLKIGGDTVSLQGPWKYKVGMISPPIPSSTTFQYQPGGLFNGMIAPLLPYRMKGVIWYQGESNTAKATEYETLFPEMIRDWRAHWKVGEFPFLYVQLANFMQTTSEPVESNWAALREAQRRALRVSNTAMVVAIDAGEWNDIHPTDKKTVGERLALAAEKLAYKEKNIVYSGPSMKSSAVQGNKIVITFTNVGGGLITKDQKEPGYFSICGPDKKYVWAKAEIKGDKVIVWSDKVSNPVAVRYAWADNPEGANLYNREGLPASPFTTEK